MVVGSGDACCDCTAVQCRTAVYFAAGELCSNAKKGSLNCFDHTAI